jgi:hypothetical protein
MCLQEVAMAKNDKNMGGPTHSPKDEPTPDRSTRNAASRDELKERTHQRGDEPGRGRRNGSDKHR